MLLLAAGAGTAALGAPGGRVGFEGKLEIGLEPLERYYYPGQPIEIKVTYRNPTGDFMTVPPDLFDTARLKALDPQGLPMKETAAPVSDGRPSDEAPAELLPRRSVERVFRLSERFAPLSKLGRHTVVWEHPQVASRTTLVKVIRAYDPNREYLADFRTSMGNFSIEFFPSAAPNNVKNFIDLANSGFYEGMQFHMIIPGILIQAGDPKGDGNGYPGYRVPPEFSRVRHLKGTVSMWHHESTVDSGSQFFVCLSAQPQLDGNYTVIGQVRDGMEVVEQISLVPTNEDRGRRPFMPLKAVIIEQVRIRRR